MGRNRVFFLMMATFIFLICTVSNAEEQSDQKLEGVTKYGVTHNVAPDREIVSVGGRYEPEGIDFYLKKKFDAMETKMDKLIEEIDNTKKELKQTNERVGILLKMAEQK